MPRSSKGILAGMAEVASTIGASKAYAHHLSQKDPEFPEPYDVVAATPIWLQTDIDAYTVKLQARRAAAKKSAT